MQIAEDAVQKLLELIAHYENPATAGIRVIAKELDKKISYEVYVEKSEFSDDYIFFQEGLKIFMDPQTKDLVDDTYAFLTEQDGQEGLFIMKNTSDCASCSETCF